MSFIPFPLLNLELCSFFPPHQNKDITEIIIFSMVKPCMMQEGGACSAGDIDEAVRSINLRDCKNQSIFLTN